MPAPVVACASDGERALTDRAKDRARSTPASSALEQENAELRERLDLLQRRLADERARSEVALESGRVLREALSQAPAPFVVLDVPSFTPRFANPPMERLMGVAMESAASAPGDAILRSLACRSSSGALYSPRDLPIFRAARGEHVQNEEVRFDSLEGGQRAVLVHASPLRDPDGAIAAVACMVTDITFRRRAEEDLLEIARGFSGEAGEPFFRSLCEHLADRLDADSVLVAEISRESSDRARTLAFWSDGAIRDGFSYDLPGTPCEKVIQQKTCVYAADVQDGFPEDEALKELGVQAYVGTPLRSTKGEPLGLLAVLFRRPLESTEREESLVEVFASRAATELERSRAEETLRESRARLELAFSATSDGDWEWNAQTGATRFSAQWARSLGYELKEIEGIPNVGLEIVHPDDLPRMREGIFALLSGESSFYSSEHRLRTKSGGYRWMNDRATVVEWDAESKPLRVVGVSRDVSERMRLTEDLRVSEEKYARIFESSPDAVMLQRWDDYVIVECNEAFQRLSGYRTEEIVGRRMPDLDLWVEEGERQTVLRALAEDVGFEDRELRMRARDGTVGVVLTSATKIDTGEESYVLSISRDITERKRTEAEREELVTELRSALAEVKTLSGLLPICSSCKSIRDDSGYWQRLERYLSRHSEAELSHGLCPTCAERLYPDYFDGGNRDEES